MTNAALKQYEGIIDSFRNEFYFLSNFYSIEFRYDGILYPSVENAYQSAKVEDIDVKRIFSNIPARQAKKLSHSLSVRDDWHDINVGIMRELLYLKFESPTMRDRLLLTCGFELVEGNDWGDVFWGRCNGCGKNMLGHLLMEVRDNLTNI